MFVCKHENCKKEFNNPAQITQYFGKDDCDYITFDGCPFCKSKDFEIVSDILPLTEYVQKDYVVCKPFEVEKIKGYLDKGYTITKEFANRIHLILYVKVEE